MTTGNGQAVPLGPRYGRLRLDGDLDDFHRALAYLGADTCDRGRCDPDTGGQCSRHEQRAQRRRQRREGGRS
jgi:hypothetical protein